MTTREECIKAAGEVYGAILADPERRAEIRAYREANGIPTDSRRPRRTERASAAVDNPTK